MTVCILTDRDQGGRKGCGLFVGHLKGEKTILFENVYSLLLFIYED
jgi:hypothetical protein